jgi:hypothetical protein
MNRKMPEIKLKIKTNLDNLNINMLSPIFKIKGVVKMFCNQYKCNLMGKIIKSSLMPPDMEKKVNPIELKQIKCFSINFTQSIGKNIENDH